MTYEIEQVETPYRGWSSLHVAHLRLPTGERIKREVEDHGVAVAVLPFDPERRTAIVVTQFRPPAFLAATVAEIIEAPAGLIDPGEDPETCAKRESLEETGVALSHVEPLGTVWSMPGVSTERIHLFLAPYREADKVGDGGGLADEHEHITVSELGLDELAAMADDGRLADLKTLFLVQTLRLRRPELFTQAKP